MRLHVCFEITGLSKAFAAFFALEWFLTSMASFVDSERAIPGKRLTAVNAQVRFFSCVDPIVVPQMSFRGEPLVTIFKIALKGFIPFVTIHMCG